MHFGLRNYFLPNTGQPPRVLCSLPLEAFAAVWGLGFVNIYGENGEGFYTAAYIMIGLLIVALIIGTIWTPKTQGKSLQQITKERYGEDI